MPTKVKKSAQKPARNTRLVPKRLSRSNREHFAIVGNVEKDPLLWGTYRGLWEELNRKGGGEDRQVHPPEENEVQEPVLREDVWRGQQVLLADISEVLALRLVEMKREGGWESFVIYRQARGQPLREWKPPKPKVSPPSKDKSGSSLPADLLKLIALGAVKRAR